MPTRTYNVGGNYNFSDIIGVGVVLSLQLIGGGAGGGLSTGSGTSTKGGGGGGGGGCAIGSYTETSTDVSNGSIATTVGTGAAAGSSANGSVFNTSAIIIANGGATATGINGGAGGVCTGSALTAGHNGGAGGQSGTLFAGGGGGSSGGTNTSGNNGGNATSGTSPGAGGSAPSGAGPGGTGTSTTTAGQAGFNPGGGGGGAAAGVGQIHPALGGADGEVIITWSGYQPVPTPQYPLVVEPLWDANAYIPKRQINASWYIPDSPPTRQPSQDYFPLRDLSIWYAADYQQRPQAAWYIPQSPPTRQPSQQYDPLPNLEEWYEQFRLQPITSTPPAPQAPPTKQPSQDYYPLPDYAPQQSNYIQPPQAAWYIPPLPPSKQPSQDYYALQDLSIWWIEGYAQPLWAIFYNPQAPETRQPTQYQAPGETPDTTYMQIRQLPNALLGPLGPSPQAPPTRQPSQAYNRLPEDTTWYQQYTRQPIPPGVSPVIQAPPLKQPTQQYSPLPEPSWEYLHVQRRLSPLQTTFYVAQAGVSGVFNTIIMVNQAGFSRVQNNIEGYNVYVGSGAQPDLTQAPNLFSLTLPINIPLTPPVSGTETFYILVQYQDTYGLVSQNQFFTLITIDSSGNLILPALLPPSNLQLFQQAGELITTLAAYATALTDTYPATGWYLWIRSSPPDTTTPPDFSAAVNGAAFSLTEGPYAPGTWYIAVALFRAADSFQSAAITGTIIISAPPTEVIAVPSGFDGP